MRLKRSKPGSGLEGTPFAVEAAMRLLPLGLVVAGSLHAVTASADPERVASVDTGVRVSTGGTALEVGGGLYAWSRVALTASAYRAGYIGAAHWREPLGPTTLDVEAGYSHGELPGAALHAGAHVELAVGQRGSFGLGGRVYSTASAASLDAYLKIPLPAGVYLRGDVTFKEASVDVMDTSITPPSDKLMDPLDSKVLLGEIAVGIDL